MSDQHGALMDRIYRGQRHIYDATRKYYLFGRDRLIAGLAVPEGGSVLEVGCGTGRNLALIGRRWRGARLAGLDISAEMLVSARAKLGARAVLALGDATGFDPVALFGRARFDRIVFSYTLSMIPDWQAALAQAAPLLAVGGSIHLVDFGMMAGLPGPVRRALRAWLALFHVAPRADLVPVLQGLAARQGLRLTRRDGLGGYYIAATLTRA